MSVKVKKTLSVALGERSYDIVVGDGIIMELGDLILSKLGCRRCFIVTDRNVAIHWLPSVKWSLVKSGIDAELIELPAGESTKSFTKLNWLVSKLLDAKVKRDDIIIALGGGVVGDLAGFAAAVTLRGLNFVQVPTTFLAQVDSSVGGKTGINTPQGKNLVGCFHQPSLVIADTRVLDTLPHRELLSGYAEVLKYGLIRNREFFLWLEMNGSKILSGDPEARLFAIMESCRIKAQLVSADEKETGDRALLNFGHTFGHALEAKVSFDDRLLHGEAVSIGMVIAMQLSNAIGICPGQDVSRVLRHATQVGLPVNISTIEGSKRWTPSSLVEHMRHDKKVLRGQMRFILIREIGEAFITTDVQESDILNAIGNSIHETVSEDAN